MEAIGTQAWGSVRQVLRPRSIPAMALSRRSVLLNAKEPLDGKVIILTDI